MDRREGEPLGVVQAHPLGQARDQREGLVKQTPCFLLPRSLSRSPISLNDPPLLPSLAFAHHSLK